MYNEDTVYFLFLSICFIMFITCIHLYIHVYIHNSWWWVLYDVLVFIFLQINDGVAGLCILYFTSFHCNYGNCSHINTR